MKKIVILGGGLAGVSAGFHLAEYEPLVIERESAIGGLCRSFSQDGFTFDCTGHLIHLKTPYVKELIGRLLPDAFNSHERLASIYSKSTITPYPFQANTYGLPAETVRECLLGFVETLKLNGTGEAANFHEWVLQTFGSGIAKHFMLPYNEKFWKQDLKGITSDWVSWAIPKPSIEEVVNGALGLTNTGMGYNPRFIYPKTGGIDCLPQALARNIRRIQLRETVRSIDTRKRVVTMESGRQEPYDSLITTLPLPVTYRLLREAPDSLKHAASQLRAVGILNINIGVDRPQVSNQHWIYYPEGQFVFSRVGFPMNFSRVVAPEGTSSLYIEITYAQGQKPNSDQVFEQALDGLRRAGILRQGDRILTRLDIDINPAYIVFDHHRQKHLPNLVAYLESQEIHTAGRYGVWDYHSMEDSIRSGKAAAEKVDAGIALAPHA
jgi:protoporphyrinogen oxidase